MKVILASQSPRRRQLLRKILKRFGVRPSKAREYHRKKVLPLRSACENAFRKAREISRRFPEALVIGADTIVVLRKKIMGKPKTLREAGRMLAALSGKTHQVITGVCLIAKTRGIQTVFSETTDVKFKHLNSKMIGNYLKAVHVLDKAGAYGIQERPRLVEKFRGSFSNVVGLPLERLAKELKKLK